MWVWVVKMSDPICGNCGYRKEAHYDQHGSFGGDYCNTWSNGDWFSEEPSWDTLGSWLEDKHIKIYKSLVAKWRSEHGYEEEVK